MLCPALVSGPNAAIDFQRVRFSQSLHLGRQRRPRRNRVVVFRVNEQGGCQHAGHCREQTLSKPGGLIPAAGGATEDHRRAYLRIPRSHQQAQRAAEGVAHDTDASGVDVVARAKALERRSGFVYLLVLEQLQLHAIAAFDAFGLERARKLIAVGYSLTPRQPDALAMEPEEDIAMAREHWPQRLRCGSRQRIACAVAAVIEQHGREWPLSGRAPHLCAQRQPSAPHIEQLGRDSRLTPASARDARAATATPTTVMRLLKVD
jgi:hypothetical protein